MSESQAHKRAKAKAAGKTGQTETPLPGGKRLDARTKSTATEVERSGSTQGLVKAARKRPANCVLTPTPTFRQAARGSILSA